MEVWGMNPMVDGVFLTSDIPKAPPLRLAFAFADPVSRARTQARDAISRIGKLTLLQRQAPTSYALRQPCTKTLQLSNSLVDATGPGARELRPIPAFRNMVLRQL